MESKKISLYEKFLNAQSITYDLALNEIRRGKKTSHWIWYIFPQLAGLGRSNMSEYYAIADLNEAKIYLENDILKNRLIEISEALLNQNGEICDIMGSPDYMKVRSCMTLFNAADPNITVFQKVIDKFYDGKPDIMTLEIISGKKHIDAKPPRWKMIEIFNDTQRFYTENAVLADAVKKSIDNSVFYDADECSELINKNNKTGKITVSKNRTFESAMKLHNKFPEKKICVLNFASATNPGGGVTNGARAQEESLCRCSTLYPTLNTHYLWEKYYLVNREKHDCLHTDACIYSPDIIICKTDETYPQRMPEDEWIKVDVITCAAPNLRHMPSNQYNPFDGNYVSMDSQKLYELHVKRAKHILSAAIKNNVDILVLGAFGCGAFRNDPYVVAKAYKNVLDECKNCFDIIEFAIFTAGNESENYTAFAEIF